LLIPNWDVIDKATPTLVAGINICFPGNNKGVVHKTTNNDSSQDLNSYIKDGTKTLILATVNLIHLKCKDAYTPL
jgi:hypothetical protein